MLPRPLLALSLLALALAAPAAAQVSTTFDADLEGWIVSGDNVVLWNGADGNPGGCLEVQDAAAGPWSIATAPAGYLGDWSGMTSADSLSYDAIHLPAAGQNGNPPYLFEIEGPGGRARYSQSGFPADTWNHFAVPIEESAWNVVSGTWADLVVNVLELRVAVEMISGDEVVRVDNIVLSQSPGDVFYDCVVQDFELNLLGWTGESTNLAIVSNDGDLGDYLRALENGAASRTVLPSWYGGDWSGFDGAGSIGFSLTFLNEPNPGQELRLDLSGPGGAAHVAVSTDGFVPLQRTWTVLSWPIDSGTWTVDSGTWAGLLADVQEIAISVDATSNSDRFGLDNFVRGGASCMGPADPLQIQAPGYSVCGVTRFRDGSALATNPADGELYALVNGTGSDGGIYAVTGPMAGEKLHTFSAPAGLVFTDDGDGFVTENNSGLLFRFVGTDSLSTWGSAFHSGDDDIAGLIVAPRWFDGPNVNPGDLIITDHGNGGPDEIWVASPDTADVERLLVPDPGSVDWYDVATDGFTVWACDSIDDDVLTVIRPDGTTSGFALSENVFNMRALAFDPGQRALYTVSTSNPIGLYRIDVATGQVTLVADGFAGVGLGNLEIDPDARRLWVSDSQNSRIYEICLPAADAVAAGEPEVTAGSLRLSLWPHPVRSSTDVRLVLPREGSAVVDILDAAGRRVRRLESDRLPAGPSTLRWDGRNEGGRPVAAGVYFLRARASGASAIGKAVVVR